MTSSPPSELQDRGSQYWRRNIRLLLGLLAVWATVSFGCGILLHHFLDNYTLPGSEYPLGFWFAQQGSIYTFVVLIFFYAWRMGKLDRKFNVHED
jgi:putative solute:sodium symporter small subunit